MMLLYPCLPHTQWCDKLEAGKAQGEGEGEARTGKVHLQGRRRGVRPSMRCWRMKWQHSRNRLDCNRDLRLPGAPVLRRLRLPAQTPITSLSRNPLFPPSSSPCPSSCPSPCPERSHLVTFESTQSHLTERFSPGLTSGVESRWLQGAAVWTLAGCKTPLFARMLSGNPYRLLLSLPSSFSLPLPLPFALPSPLLFARPLTSLSLVGVGQWVWGSGCGAVGVGQVGVGQWVWGSGCGAVGVRQWVWGSGCGAVGVGQWE
ncbi:unnamed protein product [Closterium sp. NIES-65]|nr:unnamed protein product [Closterium sp. NIES-65]